MALSEHEERILSEIERRLYDSDPDSARRLGSTTLPSYLARNCRWSGLSFLGGLVLLLASFVSSWPVALVGFLVMLVSAVVFVQNLRRLGRLHWAHAVRTAHPAGAAGRGQSGISLAEVLRDIRRRFGSE